MGIDNVIQLFGTVQQTIKFVFIMYTISKQVIKFELILICLSVIQTVIKLF